jgi:hypothetical protein
MFLWCGSGVVSVKKENYVGLETYHPRTFGTVECIGQVAKGRKEDKMCGILHVAD